jgi:putative DNA primase/helicase
MGSKEERSMAGSLPKRLSPAHQRMLFEESCLSTSVAVERSYRTVASKADLAQLGFSKPQQRVPALVVPMYSPAGEHVTHQTRPDTPRKNDKGKPIKYETPADSPIRLDVHPSQSERVREASVPLWITEGVKKADSLASRDQCVVGLQGVWCWQKDGVPLQDWEDVRLWGRSVCDLRF